MTKLPITALIVTKNAEDHLQVCLQHLSDFDEIIAVDSHSSDHTVDIAEKEGAQIIHYAWNGRYPKKRQWCLENIDTKHDWVFFIDADEVASPELIQEMRALFRNGTAPIEAGFFIRGQYIWNGKRLRFGLQNNKIALLHRRRMKFPEINDLDIPGMGEIEGHYQPVLIGHEYNKIGALQQVIYHNAGADYAQWLARHQRYATWEIGMNARHAWPTDPRPSRQCLKRMMRFSRLRPEIAFLHSYILKLGLLDGTAGFDFARSRWTYYQMIRSGQNHASGE